MFARPRFALEHNAIASLAKELRELRKLAKDRRAASLRRGVKPTTSTVPPTTTRLLLRAS
jgi:hypothetical protein